MKGKYSVQYIDRLLEGGTYSDLVEICSVLNSSSYRTRAAPTYGLPTFGFLFVETLVWFAQSIRSGVWTYYEATPLTRQRAMAAALRQHAPSGFADWYERGMVCWQEKDKIREVDQWIEKNDDLANEWLALLARENREALVSIT